MSEIVFPAELLAYLRSCTRISVLTGAGVSQESGLRTFRDAQVGIWAQYRPEDLGTPEAFARNPRLVWDFYATRRDAAGAAEPNSGHFALAEMGRRVETFTLITQNIDGLHQRAGSDVIELHGNIRRVRCSDGCGVVDTWEDLPETIPACQQCGALLRPDVIWFGENLPPVELDAAWNAASASQAFFSIGTSGLVQPAATLALVAKKRGGVVVEINMEPTPLTEQCDYAFHGKSGEILPSLVKALWG